MSARNLQMSGVTGDGNRAIDLDVLFRLYARDLTSFAFRRLRDREAAADVVQDGFVRYMVWKRARNCPVGLSQRRKGS